MRKKYLATILFVVMLMSGCSKNPINEKVLEQSDIQTDATYQQYMRLSEEGRLTEDGYYKMEASEYGQDDTGTGSVEVTFANNPYLDVVYFTDAQLSDAIGGTVYKMNPGDSIYASAVSANSVSDAYGLKEFRIIDWGTSERNEIARTVLDDSKLVFVIPTDYEGENLMIIPVGEYQEKEIKLMAYSVDSHGTKTDLRQAGIWYIDGVAVDGDTASVSAEKAYTVSYDFNEADYFFVCSEPKQFNQSPNEDGEVVFEKVLQNDGTQSYEVEIRKYLSLEIEFPASATITFKNTTETVKKNKTWRNDYLQYGDVISIETAEAPVIKGDYQHIEVVHDSDGIKYDLRAVQENSGNAANEILEVVAVERVFEIIIEPECEYGVCTFELDGEEVSGVVMAKENQELKITYKITNPDYVFANESNGFMSAVKNVVPSKKQTETVLITSAMDGVTISADSYFNVEIKGA